MESLSMPMVYEIAGYIPYNLISLSTTSKKFQLRIEKQIEYAQTLVEDLFGVDARNYSWE
jgi:hypothetical protein